METTEETEGCEKSTRTPQAKLRTFDGLDQRDWSLIEALTASNSPNLLEILAKLWPDMSERRRTARYLNRLKNRTFRSRLVAELLFRDRGSEAEKILKIAATCAISDGLGSTKEGAGRKVRTGVNVLGSLKTPATQGPNPKGAKTPAKTLPKPEVSTVPPVTQGPSEQPFRKVP